METTFPGATTRTETSDFLPLRAVPSDPMSINTSFQTNRTIGWLLISSAVLLFVPYTILSIIFDYPQILRQDAGIILTRFHQGGSSLVLAWWAFAIVGLPLFGAYVLIGQQLESKVSFARLATVLGLIGLVVQMIGLLRWTFVVPVLAQQYVSGNEMGKEASKIGFQVIHQYGGVVLGEHLGQLFTISWTVLISLAFARLKRFPKWLSWLGYGSSAIYLGAQAELFATVISGFPYWSLAGFLGSTLWLIWLILLGVRFVFKR
jgi:hypothetical protein